MRPYTTFIFASHLSRGGIEADIMSMLKVDPFLKGVRRSRRLLFLLKLFSCSLLAKTKHELQVIFIYLKSKMLRVKKVMVSHSLVRDLMYLGHSI